MTAVYIPRTKIVCTLGPASSTEEAVQGLMEAGMNVARLNFSHGTHDQHAAMVAMIRGLADTMQLPVAIMGDLQGPMILGGELVAPRTVVQGQDIVLPPKGRRAATTFRSPMISSQRKFMAVMGFSSTTALIELMAMDVHPAKGPRGSSSRWGRLGPKDV